MGSGGDDEVWREHSLDLRRERLVRAMVRVVCERGGFAGASLTALCAQAKVSRAAFYEAFDSRESCFLAALDEGHRRCAELVEHAFERTWSWLEGMRVAKAELLLFFDSDPELARVCIVESLAAGPWALERRERHVKAISLLIGDYWKRLGPGEPYPFASDGVVVSVLSVIQAHLLARRPEPLSGLLGPLMGLVTVPYNMDTRIVAEEIERSGALAAQMFADGDGKSAVALVDRPVEAPGPLLDPRAHRARRCVLYLAEHPGASNREVGKAVGIGRDPQTSKTLARLADLGLLEKNGAKPGGPNAWALTPRGYSIARLLTDDPDRASRQG